MTTINQKEYLRKYLKMRGEKTKKKKKIKPDQPRVKIIDDDTDFFVSIQEEDPFTTNEDAPQIVAIIDERPPSMRIDEKTKDKMWQPIGSASTSGANKIFGLESLMIKPKGNDEIHVDKEDKSNDVSPSMREDKSPPRRRKPRSISPSGDYSPPRRVKTEEASKNDHSPPRKLKQESSFTSFPLSRKLNHSADRRKDESPTRRTKKRSISPSQDRSQKDESPPRRRRNRSSTPSGDNSFPRKVKREASGNDDHSPPRRKKKESSFTSSPLRKKRDHSADKGKDESPTRRKKKRSISPSQDRSPLRRVKKESFPSKTVHHSPPRRRKQDSPPSKTTDDSSWRMQKTADGKSAGLQSVQAMLEESRLLREREETRFKEMSEQTSGRNAGTVLRDRKTGRKRNLEEEQKVQQQKNEEEEKKKEKYSRWGKGLVQTENREQRLQEELHEMSKPLARYADDEDLEKYLKEQERAEDPMLAYMRKKKRKKTVEDGVAIKPEFEGQFMPNRYGIRPGHRWDGVDRSNGYEKKWFEVQNSKKAQEEDSYKWSTEDM